ncbi:flagellin [Rhodalgimonas zhirmunskyi]|uniref:Flagellin n=1 Tax=Rhodalgimonas zhirmunskyi TaxID=2964767 RepID=A0AAJ1X5A6_9RHOB|nr:flagellin [Rhodoalgimonas zhirmunskyi]MDQ2093964.1 flagellin [Rhodoalgimonas zhirmunskyi]
MSYFSLGDMASSFVLRRQNTNLNSELARLAQEMSSGQTANIAQHLNGNYSYLGDIERGLRINASYATASTEASIFTGTMQAALENVQNLAQDVSNDLLIASATEVPQAYARASDAAAGALETIISSLNYTAAGRSLFAGAQSDSLPLISADEMLSELRTAVTGETTLSGILSTIDTWFDDAGGGFETLAYRGSTTNISPFLLDEAETIEIDVRADATEIRAVLKNTVIAALAGDDTLGYSHDLQNQLLTAAGENLMASQADLTALRAGLGYAESRIEENTTRLSSEKTSLEIARNNLLGVDLYETATQMEAVQLQLEGLYTATVKLTRLSLVNYIS